MWIGVTIDTVPIGTQITRSSHTMADVGSAALRMIEIFTSQGVPHGWCCPNRPKTAANRGARVNPVQNFSQNSEL